jgi:dienelactone hydrolase
MNSDRDMTASTSPISRRKVLALAAGALGQAVCRQTPAFADKVATDVDWLAEVQPPPVNISSDAPRLAPLLTENDKQIDSRDEWERKRDRIKRAWLDFLGPTARPKKVTTTVVGEERVGNIVRQLHRYKVEPDEAVEAYLLRPADAKGRLPAVAVFHSTVDHSIRQPAGLAGPSELHFGMKLAQAGFVALCPRNFLWTDTNKIDTSAAMKRFAARHPKSKGMTRMLLDAQIAIDLLAVRDDVDPKRIGAIGHSLGAKEVLYLAALDDRVRAAVFSEGGIGTKFSNWDAAWYLSDAINDNSFTREHHELLALVAPRPFLLIGGNSADGARSWPFIEAALPVYRLYGDRPRVGLYNHARGHTMTPKAERRSLQWLAQYC